LTPNRIYCWNI